MPHCSCIKLYFLIVCTYITSGFSGQWKDIYYCEASFTYERMDLEKIKQEKNGQLYVKSGKKKKNLSSQIGGLVAARRASDSKESASNAGDLGSNPGLGRSPGGGHGNLLQYSCLENFMDTGAWRATVPGVRVKHDWATFTLFYTGW